MFRKAVTLTRAATTVQQQWPRALATRASPSSSAINTMILKSLRDHYLEITKMNPPPKISPPSPFTVVKGSLERVLPVLKRVYNEEEISISVMRLANIIPGAVEADDSNDTANQLFLHVDISKPREELSLHFLCGLYPDALGIHSVSLRPKAESTGFLDVPKTYCGPIFHDLDEKVKNALHDYIEKRGINESLFEFLQAWLYVKDHRRLLGWFKAVGEFVKD